MIHIKDEVEKIMSSAEEKEKKDEEIEEEEEEEEELEDLEEDDDGDEEEGSSEEEKEDEAMSQAPEQAVENTPLPVQPKEKKQPEGLNLNNEVVKMRKEVKRVRALIIRKLTRQIGALKKKKGKETEIERNQRRAARLLEEIHAMKKLKPDLVTKAALQKNLNFEQTCKNPKSTISDRAIARIATQPQFNKKIESIKAAVKAFKEERMKDGKLVEEENVQNEVAKVTRQSPDKKGEKQNEKEEEDIAMEQKDIKGNERGVDIFKDTTDPTVAEPEKEIVKATHSADSAGSQRKEMPKNVRKASLSTKVKDIVKNTPQRKDAEKKPNLKSAPEVLHKTKDEQESDLESSDDEEKEYFDDSTEERFRKQSSQSEESEDDFFIGKVSKFKKTKKKSVEGEKEHKVGVDPTDQVQSKVDELVSRQKPKANSCQSIFYSSLSGSKSAGVRGGGRGRGRGRGGDTFRSRGKPMGGSGVNRDFNKQSKFQRQDGGIEGNSGSEFNKSEFGRGRGQGRGDGMRQNDRRAGGVFYHQTPQHALHPSWEASKKRKEQQGQILAFQGKKIKFDDDD